MMRQIEEQLRHRALVQIILANRDQHGGEENSEKETRPDNDRGLRCKLDPRHIVPQRGRYGRHGHKLRVGLALPFHGEAVNLKP